MTWGSCGSGAHLLAKPDRLTDDERRLVRLHPDWGAEMVARIPGLQPVALIVRLHHERPDGAGYPHGLSHERIPMASRIVSVCDAFGAMTKRRPYSEPLDVEAALASSSAMRARNSTRTPWRSAGRLRVAARGLPPRSYMSSARE